MEKEVPGETETEGDTMKIEILDACCGGRSMWFQKEHSSTVYIDIRREAPGLIKSRPNFEVNPDIIMDFRALGFRDNTFTLIVWDPPHMKTLRETSIMRQKYGCLNNQTWPYDLREGFKELWRVLAHHGTLILKWNSVEISQKDLLSVLPESPIFGHTSGLKGKTRWLCFYKT